MTDFNKNLTGFTSCSYSMRAYPLFDYFKIDGFSNEGITWEDIEYANSRIGADGLICFNQKPVIYKATISLLPNATCRNNFDKILLSSTPHFGKELSSYELILTENNNTTGKTYIYSRGIITNATSGSKNSLDEGQGNLNYTFEFAEKVFNSFKNK